MSGFYNEADQLHFHRGEVSARARMAADKIRDEAAGGRFPSEEKVADIISDTYTEQTLPEGLNPNPLASSGKEE